VTDDTLDVVDTCLTKVYNKYLGWQGLVPPIQWSLTGILHPLLTPNRDHGDYVSHLTSKKRSINK